MPTSEESDDEYNSDVDLSVEDEPFYRTSPWRDEEAKVLLELHEQELARRDALPQRERPSFEDFWNTIAASHNIYGYRRSATACKKFIDKQEAKRTSSTAVHADASLADLSEDKDINDLDDQLFLAPKTTHVPWSKKELDDLIKLYKEKKHDNDSLPPSQQKHSKAVWEDVTMIHNSRGYHRTLNACQSQWGSYLRSTVSAKPLVAPTTSALSATPAVKSSSTPLSPEKKKRRGRKVQKTPEQQSVLNSEFEKDHDPPNETKLMIAKRLGLHHNVVFAWFRHKLSQTQLVRPDISNKINAKQFSDSPKHTLKRKWASTQENADSNNEEDSAISDEEIESRNAKAGRILKPLSAADSKNRSSSTFSTPAPALAPAKFTPSLMPDYTSKEKCQEFAVRRLEVLKNEERQLIVAKNFNVTTQSDLQKALAPLQKALAKCQERLAAGEVEIAANKSEQTIWRAAAGVVDDDSIAATQS